jgi:hypothetical protein
MAATLRYQTAAIGMASSCGARPHERIGQQRRQPDRPLHDQRQVVSDEVGASDRQQRHGVAAGEGTQRRGRSSGELDLARQRSAVDASADAGAQRQRAGEGEGGERGPMHVTSSGASNEIWVGAGQGEYRTRAAVDFISP